MIQRLITELKETNRLYLRMQPQVYLQTYPDKSIVTMETQK